MALGALSLGIVTGYVTTWCFLAFKGFMWSRLLTVKISIISFL